MRKFDAVGTALIAIPNAELRRQVTEFISAQGYTCVTTPTVGAALEITAAFCSDLEFVIADVRLPEARSTAKAIAARPGTKALLLSPEPEFVMRELVADPTVTFLEKPFAWCELERALCACDAVLNAA